MKRIAKWGLKFLLVNPELLEVVLEPLLEKPKVVRAIKSKGPVVRRIIKMLEKAVQ